MLRNIQDFEDYAIQATDGEIGHVKDFYFDDFAWVVRHFVVETGSWLESRKVLISPIAISPRKLELEVFPVSITKQQVKNSPAIDTEKPVSRQHEIDLLSYYGYPHYWGGLGFWGENTYPGQMLTGTDNGEDKAQTQDTLDTERNDKYDPHLRSCQALLSYHLIATDGDVGRVKGFLVDEETWAIRYLVVKTGNWWFGHKALISPEWITDINWSGAEVKVDLTRQSVKDSPTYDAEVRLSRQEELRLYEHYGKCPYWNDIHPDIAKVAREPAHLTR